MESEQQRTAIVTGAGKRVGAELTRSLLDRGWTVLAHVRDADAVVPEGAQKVAANLAEPDCADIIFAAARDLPPLGLLVNNAARFAHDGFGAFSVDEFDRHMAINVRAPVLLAEAFAAAHPGPDDALIVNILDAKLAAPNPDFLSYTLSKQALAGFTELAARALSARGIRVNAVAPSLMLRSPGQTEANFAAMHHRNPLRRGTRPQDVVAAIDYLLAVKGVTGEVLVIDGGERFDPPGRDVQFLESE